LTEQCQLQEQQRSPSSLIHWCHYIIYLIYLKSLELLLIIILIVGQGSAPNKIHDNTVELR